MSEVWSLTLYRLIAVDSPASPQNILTCYVTLGQEAVHGFFTIINLAEPLNVRDSVAPRSYIASWNQASSGTQKCFREVRSHMGITRAIATCCRLFSCNVDFLEYTDGSLFSGPCMSDHPARQSTSSVSLCVSERALGPGLASWRICEPAAKGTHQKACHCDVVSMASC